MHWGNKPRRPTMRTRAFATSLTLAALIAGSTAAIAPDKITIMVGGYEKQIYLPAKLTEALGYFKDEGLDVELLNEESGVNAENEMLAGVGAGGAGFSLHCMALRPR